MILFIIYKVTVNVIVLRFYTIDRSALVVRCQCKYQCDEQSLYPENVSAARCELFNFEQPTSIVSPLLQSSVQLMKEPHVFVNTHDFSFTS